MLRYFLKQRSHHEVTPDWASESNPAGTGWIAAIGVGVAWAPPAHAAGRQGVQQLFIQAALAYTAHL